MRYSVKVYDRLRRERRWAELKQMQPELIGSAERWAEVMEEELRLQHTQIRYIAEYTLGWVAPRLSRSELTIVIDALYECWQYGPPLRHWARHAGRIA